jgi:16S rRNA processing protein RimM
VALTPHLDEKKLLVGKINGFFGVQGWVKIFSYTEPRKNILEYQPWFFIDNGTYKVIEITTGREQSKTIIAHVKGIDNRDQAGQLIGKGLYINKDQLPELSNVEHYWYELTGFQVINKNQVDLGVVDYLVDTGSNNVLVTKGDKEHWIPYIEPFLVSVDKQNRVISVDWDENF